VIIGFSLLLIGYDLWKRVAFTIPPYQRAPECLTLYLRFIHMTYIPHTHPHIVDLTGKLTITLMEIYPRLIPTSRGLKTIAKG
jgi:hypothetical protein